MKSSVLVLLLALGCTGPKEKNSDQQKANSSPQTESSPQADSTTTTLEATKANGSGSIVGNALIGDETIMRIDIAGPYIGIEGSKLYNYDEGKKRGLPVSGDLKFEDRVVKAELPERIQAIKDLTNDLFILIRDRDFGLNLAADAYLVRKSDGNVWQIYVGTNFLSDSISWIQENETTTIYYAGAHQEGDTAQYGLYGIKVRADSEAVGRIKLANAYPYELRALVGDEVTFRNENSAHLWVTNAFSNNPVIRDVGQLGFRSYHYAYTAGRAYRIDNLERGFQLFAVADGPHQGKSIAESSNSGYTTPQWIASRNGIDVLAVSFGHAYIIDPTTKSVIKELDLPNLTKSVEFLESQYITMVSQTDDSELCVITSTEIPVGIICSDKLTLGVAGRPYKVTSIDAFHFKIHSRINGTSNQQELLIKISGDKLEVQSEVSTPYSPQTDTLIPIKNIYDGL